jgi:phosphatidylinositol alpha 1,6-mannosyltransferase
MRVAIATESYLPDVNGVANSVLQVAHQLHRRGHDPLVIAPRPAPQLPVPDSLWPVVRLPAVSLPGYPAVRMALPGRLIGEVLRRFNPDVVHLASPFVLGAWAAAGAERAGIPIVAVYQTDVPAYAREYRFTGGEGLSWRWIRRVHDRAALTLAPSSTTAAQLAARGVERIRRWGRGVDLELFHPGRRRDELRRELAPDGEVIVGYVGRLAREKRVDLLAPLSQIPGVRVVIVGDGPVREELAQAMPEARFLGTRVGTDLAEVFASLDIFVHTGPYETFCQTVQEALASGVPVVAPAAGGPVDLVADRRTGRLVAPEDADAIVEAVSGLVADAQLRHRYGAAARDSVRSRDWSSIVDELLGHYRDAIAMTRGEVDQLTVTSGVR